MVSVAQGGTTNPPLEVLTRNSGGQAIDAVNLTLTIKDPLGVVQFGPLGLPPIVHVGLGVYQYTWSVPGGAMLGPWEATWDGVILGTPVETVEVVDVVAPGSIVTDDYTYDLATDVGKIRLNIDDRDVSMVDTSIPLDERSALFSDAEITAILGDPTVRNNVNLASAHLLLVVANNKKLLVQSRRIGRTTVDYGNVRADLIRQAAAFVQAGTDAPADGYSEQFWNDFSGRQIIFNRYLRGE